MYQQEYRHTGLGGGSVFVLISTAVRTLARYKASMVTWAIVAAVVLGAVITQNYVHALAPASTGTVGSGTAIAAPSPAMASPTPAESRAPATAAPAVQAPAPAAVVVPPAPAAAPVAPPAAVVAAPAADTNAYTVASGDTVGQIAARFGVDVNAMLAANGLSASSIIVPGQVLKLTGPPVAAVAPAVPAAAAPAAAPAPAPAAAVRTIYVAGSGGQAAVDSCIGPIHFTPTDAYSLFITEHDFCGGWAQFSGIGVGETVSIPGYGTYKVSARGQVPQGGTTNDVAAVFGGFPRAVLQTCVPGTSQMLVIALN
ncbi:LysM peptidoglycan-binding domain-containing protein [Arthrobacter sp. NA-172]|uniref:LysM peptidoglycan-binding domain-containing protein n=1 Tax=Arthrobacter sp. NA-172 TaxID=3367524 RepID=UPI0037540C87